jgi:D-aminopeptidase
MRTRDLGIEIGFGRPGPNNAITDVPGVRVGQTTLIEGDGPLVTGRGPIRTGVTVVVPREAGREHEPVFAGCHRLNGNGELTGLEWIRDSGLLTTPIGLTNTHSVGVVRDAIIAQAPPGEWDWSLPVVGETWDGFLNDINGFHVKPEHAIAALDAARGGPVAEGNVGGGTGMVCHGFKGGIGTASRRLSAADGGYTIGVLVQCNYGLRRDLRVGGVPVGEEIPGELPCISLPDAPLSDGMKRCSDAGPMRDDDQGSIIVVVATDAPLLPHQLKRIATRPALGIGRMGGRGNNSSGDIFVAFSTANPGAAFSKQNVRVEAIPNDRISPLFAATIQATEEAILNALLAAETMTGADGARVTALPVDRLLAALRKYNRLP